MEEIIENLRVSDIAKMIDNSFLHPTFTDSDLEEQCKITTKHRGLEYLVGNH
jgi:hypothetical protein